MFFKYDALFLINANVFDIFIVQTNAHHGKPFLVVPTSAKHYICVAFEEDNLYFRLAFRMGMCFESDQT